MRPRRARVIVASAAGVVGVLIGHWLSGWWAASVATTAGLAIGYFGTRYLHWYGRQHPRRTALSRDNHERL